MCSKSTRLVFILLNFSLISLLISALPPIVQGETLAGVTERVSVASNGTQGNGTSYWGLPSISADGRYVAFTSQASNLVNDDTNDTADIFVHDRQTGQTARVSVASDGTQGNGWSQNAVISADGRYVAFDSASSNLVNSDSDSAYDIFIHDRQTGQTELVSVNSDGTQISTNSHNASISNDGRFVAFVFGYGEWWGYWAVFVHDRQTGQTTRVSVASDGTSGNSHSRSPSISADGRYVAFDSEANNLVSGDTNGAEDVFFHDRQTGQTTRISVTSSGTGGNGGSRNPSLSDDGRYVTFESQANNLVNEDNNGNTDIFVYDRQTGQTSRVSVASDGSESNGSSIFPSISDDGRFVAFNSSANNLVAGDTNGADDIFVHDRQTGQTTRVSVASDSSEGNGWSNWSSISGDGRSFAFDSAASNLVDGDTNGYPDVFVHEREDFDLFNISGRIIDNVGLPISMVEIKFENGSVFTDENGDYVIDNLNAGTYSLEPFHSDYQFAPYPLSVTVGPSATDQDFAGVHCLPGNNFNRTEQNLCSSGTPPLFDLPIDYWGTTFWIASSGNVDGSESRIRRVNSWFDHWSPTQSTDDKVGVWSGVTYTTTVGRLDVEGCAKAGGTGIWCYDGHEGIDFASRWYNVGEYIFAAAPGTVIDVVTGWRLENIDADPELEEVCDSDMGISDSFAKCYNGLGNQIWIDHGNGYLTIYGHLDNIFVAESQQIEATDLDVPIAEMGSTGNSSGIHLHFEVRHDWLENWPYTSHIDPFGWASSSTMDPWTNQYGATSQWLWKYPGASQEATSQTVTTVLSSPSDAIVVSVPAAASPTPFIQLWENGPNQTLSDILLRRLGTSFLLRLMGNSTASLTPEINDFNSPVTIDISYSMAEPSHLDESQLSLYWYDEVTANWLVQATTVNSVQNKLQATTIHTGAFDLQAPLICPDDILEPNDSFYVPTNLLTDGNSKTTLFDISTDEDWFAFDANGRMFYHITTTNLAPGVDTVLELFDTDGVTQLVHDVGSSGASIISWFAQSDGRYYVRVSQELNSDFGCDKIYDISIQEIVNYERVYLPGIFRSN